VVLNITFTISENIRVQDSYTVVSDYLFSITEAVTLLDDLCYNGWFKINTSQSAGWTGIDTAQPCS
jgi:hypothetical protein